MRNPIAAFFQRYVARAPGGDVLFIDGKPLSRILLERRARETAIGPSRGDPYARKTRKSPRGKNAARSAARERSRAISAAKHTEQRDLELAGRAIGLNWKETQRAVVMFGRAKVEAGLA